jgi:6-phosphofructokinase 1
VFISHSSKDVSFVKDILIPILHAHAIDTWFSPEDVRSADEWHRKIVIALRKCDWFLVILTPASVNSEWVRAEVHWAMDQRWGKIVPILLSECDTDELHLKLRSIQFVDFRNNYKTGRENLLSTWDRLINKASKVEDKENLFDCDISNPLGLTLEQATIVQILHGDRGQEVIQQHKWPKPTFLEFNKWIDNKLYVNEETEQSTSTQDLILDWQLRTTPKFSNNTISFTKAKCFSKIPYFVSENSFLNVAILVSGGIAPGTNALIDSIVRKHWEYADAHNHSNRFHIFGLHNGFDSFDDYHNSYSLLTPKEMGFEKEIVTSKFFNQGGSILGTSRLTEINTRSDLTNRFIRIAQMLRDEFISILYIIGGDASMRTAHTLSEILRDTSMGSNIAIIGVPKSIYNDILWVSKSVGSFSPVSLVSNLIDIIHLEVISSPRICIVNLSGSSGQFSCEAVKDCGNDVCDAILINESPFTIGGLSRYIGKRLKSNGHAVIVTNECPFPMDGIEILSRWGDKIELSRDEKESVYNFTNGKRRVFLPTQVDGSLRNAVLKIVSRGLKLQLDVLFPDLSNIRIFTHEPRHLLRSTLPTDNDKQLSEKIGTAAVNSAMGGNTDIMIANWKEDIVIVPLELASMGARKVDISGDLWKSVTAKTGQPENLI